MDAQIEYPGGADSAFYIGSTGNIRKRIKEHLKLYNKNGGIRGYLEKYDCLFRYIVLEAGWQREEKKLYDLFATDFGASPRCNRVSPWGGSGSYIHEDSDRRRQSGSRGACQAGA